MHLQTAEEVKTLMASSQTQEEWNAHCAQVKAAHGGHYPTFWYSAIITSGLWQRVCDRLQLESNIQITSF